MCFRPPQQLVRDDLQLVLLLFNSAKHTNNISISTSPPLDKSLKIPKKTTKIYICKNKKAKWLCLLPIQTRAFFIYCATIKTPKISTTQLILDLVASCGTFLVFLAALSPGKHCNTERPLSKMKNICSLQMSDFCDILSYGSWQRKHFSITGIAPVFLKIPPFNATASTSKVMEMADTCCFPPPFMI